MVCHHDNYVALSILLVNCYVDVEDFCSCVMLNMDPLENTNWYRHEILVSLMVNDLNFV